MKKFKQIWLWFWFVAFIVFALLQFNDPDPEVWATWYFIASAACLWSVFNFKGFWACLIIAVISLVWAFFQWPVSFEGFEQVEPHNMNIERARETGGLVIVGLVMLVNARLVLKSRRN